MSGKTRMVLLITLDIVAIFMAGIIALWLRFEGQMPGQYLTEYLQTIWLYLLLVPIVHGFFGLYNRLWRYASIRELISIVLAVTVGMLSYAFIMLVTPGAFPRSVLVLMWLLGIFLVGSIRFVIRVKQELLNGNGHQGIKRTLIVGAGDAGTMMAKEINKHSELEYKVVGFADDNPHKKGYIVAGVPVLGTAADIQEIVERQEIEEIIIAMPSAPGKVIRQIIHACDDLDVRVRTVPGLFELVNDSVSLSQVREVQIEDLLGRAEIKVDLGEIGAFLSDKVVLVTGAGGSIGSEICRQVARFKPETLLLFGHGENTIYDIDLELKEKFPHLEVIPLVGDIQDRYRVEEVFSVYQPEVVFHAAAHKHVPLMEISPAEAVKNNIFGTQNIAEMAIEYGVERFVLISTDKAVNPKSVMGGSKRAAEILIQEYNRKSNTKFVAVRFGNVLGSRGSVVPLFKKQIIQGGPITVTHQDMTRYFMTIPEAVSLVIQAAAMGNGGEVFVLDMGEPVKIVDLAKDMIRLSGLELGRDIEIVFTGMRPGEKLHEEIFFDEESMVATRHNRIYVSRCESMAPEMGFEQWLAALREAAASGTDDSIRLLLMLSVHSEKTQAI